MTIHPALTAGRAAVITGGASGIGLAAARAFAGLGLHVVIADLKEDALAASAEALRAEAPAGVRIEAVPIDVSIPDQVTGLREFAFDRFGDVAVLMNNAGVSGGAGAYDHPERWARVLSVNFGGVLNGVQAFTQPLIDQGRPALIVNTGSKQGITTPPGDTAYNVSKAALKVLTEGLAHSLRQSPGCAVSAHLLIPGFTFTGLTRGAREKPAGAWTSEEVVAFMLQRLAAGDFYILCPDHDTPRALDEARMAWAIGDIIENRPALSRWHEDYKAAFAAFVAARA